MASSALSSTIPPSTPDRDGSKGGLFAAGLIPEKECIVDTGTELALFKGGGAADEGLEGKYSLFLFLAFAAAAAVRRSDSFRARRVGAGGMAMATDGGTDDVR